MTSLWKPCKQESGMNYFKWSEKDQQPGIVYPGNYLSKMRGRRPFQTNKNLGNLLSVDWPCLSV